MSELRLAIRSLLKSPVLSAVAVISIALGIGANTAMFTLVDQVLLRFLPVQNPKELVQLRLEGGRVGSQNGDGVHTFSYPQYVYFRDHNTVFSGLTGQYLNRVSMTSDERSEMAGLALVAGNYFQVLGVRPHIGRLLTPEDDKVRGGHPVAVLQYDYWISRFAGRKEIVGQTIRLAGAPYTVLGVAAQGFEGTDTGLPNNVWAPIMMHPEKENLDDERYAWFYLFGRLKPGTSHERAQAAMKVLYSQRQQDELKGPFFQRFPDTKESFLRQTFSLVPAARGRSSVRDRFEQPLIVLQWLVGLVLLIACANVANLLLARAASRQKEIAVRAALGASRIRIIRQLLTESLVLAIAGGVAGLVCSFWLARGLLALLPYDPANLTLSAVPDLRVMGFAMAVTLLTALIFGMAPAWQGSRVPAALTLREEAGSVTGGRGHVRVRKTLVALQVGLSTMLLAGAGLFVQTLQNLQNVDLGFQTENVVMFGVRPATPYDPPRKLQTYRAVLEGLASVPGAKAVGANTSRLLTGGRWDSQISMPGARSADGRLPWSFFNAVSPGYFDALGIPIKNGRDFTWADWDSTQRRCLVNEALVTEYLGGESPVGRMMAQGRDNTPDTEIIGVFGNARYHNVRGTIPRQTFIAMGGPQMRNVGAINVYVRSDRDPRQMFGPLREVVKRVDSNLVVYDMRLLDDQLNQRLGQERMLSFLSAGFALLATTLAVVGLYGVLAFVVARRTREIGIRMALGAGRGNVIRMVLLEMMAIVIFGLAAGVVGGILTGRYVESLLFGVQPADATVFLLSVLVLLGSATLAGFLPAWRASRIDPMYALRYE